ncbi:MAG: RND family transporter [Spirochaetes bacterium]|nr:RND family transporter [Spirochaetota bacterium]
MKKIAKFITRFPIAIMLFILIISGFSSYGIRYLKINTNIKDAIPDSMEVKKFYNEVEEIFSSGDAIIVGVFTENIFNKDTIGLINKLTKEFEKIEGIDKVISPTNVDYMEGTEWGLEIDPIIEEIPETKEEIENFKKKLLSIKLYKGMIVSEDYKVAGIIINLEDNCNESKIYKKIKNIISQENPKDEIFIAGEPSVLALLEITMIKNLKHLIPIVLIVIFLILYLSFRSIRGVLLPLLTVSVSTLVVLGIMGYLRIEISILATVLPVLLIAVGSAYGIHLVNRFYEDIANGLGKREAVVETVSHTGLAVLIAGVTTIIGFASLALSGLKTISIFGLMSSLGIIIALCFSVLFIPSFLMILPVPKIKKNQKENEGFTEKILKGFASIIYEKRKIVVILFIIFFVLSIIGMLRLKIDVSMVNEFNKKSEIRIADRFINEYLLGTNNFSVIFETKNEGGIKEPALLNEMLNLQKFISKKEFVGGSSAITDFIMEINKTMNEGKEKFYRIPESRELVAQYLLLYSMSGDEEDLNNFVDFNYKKARMLIFLKTSAISDIIQFKKEIKKYTEEHFPKDVNVRISGFSELLITVNDILIKSQIFSILCSLILVFIIVSITFKSLIIGCVSAIPITLTVIFNFGLMGLFGVELNVETVLIASIAIGIGIDYTIHFLSRYEVERAILNNNKEAMIATYKTTGKAILINAITVAGGLLVIAFSDFRGLKYFGIFIAITMITSSFNALSILPVILNLKGLHFIEKHLDPNKMIRNISEKVNFFKNKL